MKAGRKPRDALTGNVDGYIYKYEQVLKEREEEGKWKQTRHNRFDSIIGITKELKKNLISAVYPRGGHIATKLLGMDEIQDTRIDEDKRMADLFRKDSMDAQSKRIKELAERFDAPKRVEIKELELGLKNLLEFTDITGPK